MTWCFVKHSDNFLTSVRGCDALCEMGSSLEQESVAVMCVYGARCVAVIWSYDIAIFWRENIVRRMGRRNALISRLTCVKLLGSFITLHPYPKYGRFMEVN
jgi:hypothetical protein